MEEMLGGLVGVLHVEALPGEPPEPTVVPPLLSCQPISSLKVP